MSRWVVYLIFTRCACEVRNECKTKVDLYFWLGWSHPWWARVFDAGRGGGRI